MNRFWKKTFIMCAVTILSAGLTACQGKEKETKATETQTTTQEDTKKTEDNGEQENIQLNIWYTDEGIQAYMNNASQEYSRQNNVTVTPQLISPANYLEEINQRNIENSQIVDVYILDSQLLEKAYLAGLALDREEGVYTTANYPEVALSSSRYLGRLAAYPFYFETEFFLYNKNFVETPPASFQEIIDFSETYEQSEYEGIEMILQWDVSDLLYNYGFIGAYLNLGGPDRDDRSIIDINNQQVIDALTFYKRLNQSLYFDAKESDYNTVIQRFLEGKILYTIGSTKSLADLKESEFQYGIASLPALNETMESRALSLNYLAVVNPYSESTEAAQDFAQYLTYEYAPALYETSAKLPSRRVEGQYIGGLEGIWEAYEASVEMPKLTDTVNFWIELEVAMNSIWNTELSEELSEEDIDATQLEEVGLDELKKQKVQEQIVQIVTEKITRVQEQMERQLAE